MARPLISETIAVALSGGVDSSVAAALMLEAGHRVFGLTMLLSGEASSSVVVERAGVVAQYLGVPHHVVDCRDFFQEQVLDYCWQEYNRGRTPNPCVRCNPQLKFGLLLERARELGATALATGHHARLVEVPGTDAPVVVRGRDPLKDQSYFLCRLTAAQRRVARFPIGELTKDQVRQAARQRSLPSADAPESQDTCFMASVESDRREGAFAEALRERLEATARRGPVVDRAGRFVSQHQGIHLFTVGQRRGLGVSLGQRAYVVRLDGPRAEVVVTTDPADLRSETLIASGVRWAVLPVEGEPFSGEVQIRYRHRPVPAEVTRLGTEGALVRFASPVTAAAPGQAAVFYVGDQVRGGGWIDRVEVSHEVG